MKLQKPRWTTNENKKAYVIDFFFRASTALVELGLLTGEVSGSQAVRHTTLDKTPMVE
jgi:hypothetical protein